MYPKITRSSVRPWMASEFQTSPGAGKEVYALSESEEWFKHSSGL